MRCLSACLGAVFATALASATFAGAASPDGDGTDPQTGDTITHMLCRMIENSAHANRLPVGFITRLVWQESRFQTELTSRAGAKGIAQFMPRTAAARGLANPFEPEAAIGHAAELLSEFERQFGNIGLAAAAYNAGAGRVSRWLQGQTQLSNETRNYVRLITDRPVEDWAAARGRDGAQTEAGAAVEESCIVLTADLRRASTASGAAVQNVWQVHLDGSLSSAADLMAAFAMRSARLPQPASRAVPDQGPPPPGGAEDLCDSTRAFGISCAVYP